jgi:hypothetical protein
MPATTSPGAGTRSRQSSLAVIVIRARLEQGEHSRARRAGHFLRCGVRKGERERERLHGIMASEWLGALKACPDGGHCSR